MQAWPEGGWAKRRDDEEKVKRLVGKGKISLKY